MLACGVSACNARDRALQADLTLYLQRANDWSPVEAETAKTIDRILATQFVDEAEVRRQVVANAPRIAAHLERVEAVQPQSDELQSLHRHYVATWRQLAIGYDRILRGLDTGAVPDLAAGRAALEAWRTGILDTARELRRLQQDVAA
jgi:hypothetical protein